MDVALLPHHSQAAQMLESCRNWLDPSLGLIKLANPAAGTGFQGQDWRGHKLEVSRTLLGGARAWHNSDGKWFVRFREGAEWVGHSCTLGRWKMKLLQQRRGSAVDPADERVATRDTWLPATPPPPRLHPFLLLFKLNVGERSMLDEQLYRSFLLPGSLFSKVTLN